MILQQKFTHKQVSVAFSLVDSLNKEITHVTQKDPNELGRLFFEELRKRKQTIVNELRQDFGYPNSFKYLDSKRKVIIKDYIFQVSVIGYNSARYDLPLAK